MDIEKLKEIRMMLENLTLKDLKEKDLFPELQKIRLLIADLDQISRLKFKDLV